MIGELYASFEFETPAKAKRAWERVQEHCRGLGVYRWAMPEDFERQFVTVLGEGERNWMFDRACRLLGQDGTAVPTPKDTLDACRARRERLGREGGGRQFTRAPSGFRVDSTGRMHPVRKPQG